MEFDDRSETLDAAIDCFQLADPRTFLLFGDDYMVVRLADGDIHFIQCQDHPRNLRYEKVQ